MKIRLCVMCKPISEQLQEMNLVQTGTPIAILDRAANEVNFLYLHGFLTEAETDKARNRIVKKIKVKKIGGEE